MGASGAVYSCCVRALAADSQLTAVHLLAAVVPHSSLPPPLSSSSSSSPTTNIQAHLHSLPLPVAVSLECSPAAAADRNSMENNSVDMKECVANNWKKQVVDLLYWRDVKSTGAVFGATLLLLLSLTMCSIVSVCSYIGLALLSVTICFRIYKGILQAIQKSDEGHPFKQFLDKEVALSEDMVHKYSDMALSKINKSISDLRRLFLVEDLVDSIKFAVLMWIMTYVGSLFNGLTLVILVVVAAFVCPIVYEKHQVQIDHYLALVNNQIKDVVGKIQAKVPGMKRKTE
uniref:Reticulon n=1 Tax=Neogobius melanostomus TaxID=47308 RepID=A0A8C6S529_9GOBI